MHDHGAVAQGLEQAAHNRSVVGSIPTRPTSPSSGRNYSSGRGRGNPHELGASSEVEVFAALHRAGYVVCLPFGQARHYDCVIEREGSFQRVQVKTGFLNGHGAILWECRSIRFYDSESRDYRGEADLFAVWVPEIRECFLVPVAECGRVRSALRLVPAKNGQRKGIRPADEYRLR